MFENNKDKAMLTQKNKDWDYWSSKIYPSGDASIGYVRPKKETAKDKREKEFVEKVQKRHYYETHDYGGHQIRYTDETHLPGSQQWDEAYMGLSSPINSHKTQNRAKRGSKGISTYARRIIKSGAALLEQRYGVKRLALVTLTLPTLPYGITERFLKDEGGWSNLVRKVVQEFRRALKRKGRRGEIVGCIEIQEDRYRTYGEVAPHLHLIFEAHGGDYNYYLSKDDVRDIWKRCVNGQLSRVNIPYTDECRAATRIENIKKSAKNYIGKYMSKGGEIIEEIKADGKTHLLPSAWMICTKNLKQCIKDNIVSWWQELKEVVLSKDYQAVDSLFYFLRPVAKMYEGDEFIMGYYGVLKNYQIKSDSIKRFL